MKNCIVSILLILMISLSPTILANKVLYIQTAKANILDKPSFSGNSLAKISKGEIVEIIVKKPNWVKIRTADQQGWVAAMLLSETPPLSKSSLLNKLKTTNPVTHKTTVRTRASIQATAAATRGLRDRADASNGQKNYKSVIKVESQQVTEKDAWKFHKKLLQQK